MKFIYLFLIILLFKNCQNNKQTKSGQNKISVKEDFQEATNFHKKLALRWAPIHYQFVEPVGVNGLNGKGDYLTAMNYDGDWNGENNWENLKKYPAHAVVYYSVVESETHWFIIYAFFHPRDWEDTLFIVGEHENDLEGVLEIIVKNDSEYGNLIAAVSVFHTDFYLYKSADNILESGRYGVIESEPISFAKGFDNQLHPKTTQESKGHGLKMLTSKENLQKNIQAKVIYYPSPFHSEEPSGNFDFQVNYKLINMFAPNEIWDQRNNKLFFASETVIRGNNGLGSAQPPWGWDDYNDGAVNKFGEIATDPIKLVKNYFSNLGIFSDKYIYNPYVF